MDTLPPPPSGNEWELDVEDAFGEHNIEYWVWSGKRLVPATREQVAIIREREALSRLRAWATAENQRATERAHVLRPGRLAAWLRGISARLALAGAARFRPAAPAPSNSAANPVEAATSTDHSSPERSTP